MLRKIDHLVITTESMEACIDFYEKLGFTAVDGGARFELYSGDFKINVHYQGRELLPKAASPLPGSADLCFEIDGSISECKAHLLSQGLSIVLGPVTRHGVNGEMKSLYLRDPDGNLIELCSYE